MWQLSTRMAHLTLPDLKAEVDPLEPWAGLQRVQLGSSATLATHVLQIDTRQLVATNRLPLELYTRGADLVSVYAPSEARNIQTTIYWRGRQFIETTSAANSSTPQLSLPTATGVEIILSAQTHLLDSRPACATWSQLSSCPVCLLEIGSGESDSEILFQSGERIQRDGVACATIFLFRPVGANYSYLEMMHPADFVSATLERRDDTLRLTQQLFPDRLEKGVIRRARFIGVFLPRGDDVAISRACYREWIGAPPPLTT